MESAAAMLTTRRPRPGTALPALLLAVLLLLLGETLVGETSAAPTVVNNATDSGPEGHNVCNGMICPLGDGDGVNCEVHIRVVIGGDSNVTRSCISKNGEVLKQDSYIKRATA